MLHTRRRAKYLKSIRSFLMLLRRGHLYFGLFLAPWAILYGLSAYLFNHPTHFSDQPLSVVGAAVVRAAGVRPLGSADQAAAAVASALQNRFPNEAIELKLPSNASWRGEFAFAEVEVDNRLHQLLLYRNATGGTLRNSPKPEPQVTKTPRLAPFEISVAGGSSSGGPARAARGRSSADTAAEPRNRAPDAAAASALEPLLIDDSWALDVQPRLPEIFVALGVDLGDAQPHLTSVPILQFELHSQSGDWQVAYDPLKGSVQASESKLAAASELSWRRFLLRLHTTHGYPSEANSRWLWAIFVDIMAFVMLFWALSGFIMWWHIKRTRKWGLAVFATSALLATYLATSMHQELSAATRSSNSASSSR